MDNGWNDNGSDMVVIYERHDSEVTFNPNARGLRLRHAQQEQMDRRSDVTATASNDSAERRWQEVMQRRGRRLQHGGSSATPSDSSVDLEDSRPARHTSSPKAQQEQLAPTTSRRVWSPKQANGVITPDKEPERNRANESGRREAIRNQVHQEQSPTATSKQMRSAQRTGNSSAAPVVISSDSEADEIEKRHGNGKKSRAKDVDGARHSSEHVASADDMDHNKHHTRSRRHMTSHLRARHSSQEQAKSQSTPRRHGVKKSNVMDKRREDGSRSPVRHRRDLREAVQKDSDDDSDGNDSGYLQSELRLEANSKHRDDNMEQLGAQFLEFLKLKSSPKSSTPCDKDGKGKRHERRADESDERRR